MNNILHSPVSAVHLISALLALILGTYVWLRPKGNRRHQQLGYAYVGCMIVLLATAFNIYHLFGRFGIVHWGAVGASLSLTVGVLSAALRWPTRSWRLWHYFGMGGSLLGLYTTLVVESTYRFFPARYFWWTTFGTGSVLLVLGAVMLWYRAGYKERTERKKEKGVVSNPYSFRPLSLLLFGYTATGALMAGCGL